MRHPIIISLGLLALLFSLCGSVALAAGDDVVVSNNTIYVSVAVVASLCVGGVTVGIVFGSERAQMRAEMAQLRADLEEMARRQEADERTIRTLRDAHIRAGGDET